MTLRVVRFSPLAALWLLSVSARSAAKFPPCSAAPKFEFKLSDYAYIERNTLLTLSKQNHPVGLYYAATQDLKNDNISLAKEKLLRAGELGLAPAYLRLSELAKDNREHELSRHFEKCAAALKPQNKNAHQNLARENDKFR